MRAPTSTMEELRKRLEELISEPLTSPRGEVQAVLESVANDPTAAERLIRQALRQTENDEIWLDEVPRIGPDHVPDFTRRAPDLAAEAALVMLGHMTSDTWGTVTRLPQCALAVGAPKCYAC